MGVWKPRAAPGRAEAEGRPIVWSTQHTCSCSNIDPRTGRGTQEAALLSFAKTIGARKHTCLCRLPPFHVDEGERISRAYAVSRSSESTLPTPPGQPHHAVQCSARDTTEHDAPRPVSSPHLLSQSSPTPSIHPSICGSACQAPASSPLGRTSRSGRKGPAAAPRPRTRVQTSACRVSPNPPNPPTTSKGNAAQAP